MIITIVVASSALPMVSNVASSASPGRPETYTTGPVSLALLVPKRAGMIIMSTQLLHVKPSLTPQLKRISKSKDDDEHDDVEGYRNDDDDDDVEDKNDEGSYR